MIEFVPVIQADREAVRGFHTIMAAQLMEAIHNPLAGTAFGEDLGDLGPLVQAFARHRLATSSAEASGVPADMVHRLIIHAYSLEGIGRDGEAGEQSVLTNADIQSYAGLLREAAAMLSAAPQAASAGVKGGEA